MVARFNIFNAWKIYLKKTEFSINSIQIKSKFRSFFNFKRIRTFMKKILHTLIKPFIFLQRVTSSHISSNPCTSFILCPVIVLHLVNRDIIIIRLWQTLQAKCFRNKNRKKKNYNIPRELTREKRTIILFSCKNCSIRWSLQHDMHVAAREITEKDYTSTFYKRGISKFNYVLSECYLNSFLVWFNTLPNKMVEMTNSNFLILLDDVSNFHWIFYRFLEILLISLVKYI